MKKKIKSPFLFLGLAVLSVVLHNAVYALFGIEEPVFFGLTLLFALAFITSIIYSLFVYIKDLKKK